MVVGSNVLHRSKGQAKLNFSIGRAYCPGKNSLAKHVLFRISLPLQTNEKNNHPGHGEMGEKTHKNVI